MGLVASCRHCAQLRKAMEVLGCEAWDVGAVFTTDKEVSSLNSKVSANVASKKVPSLDSKVTEIWQVMSRVG